MGNNESWFMDPGMGEERTGNINLLAEIISKQADLQKINLSRNAFSSNATSTIMAKIAENPNTNLKLTNLNLYQSANFDAEESVEKLADILMSASSLKECDINCQQGNRKVKVEIVYATA